MPKFSFVKGEQDLILPVFIQNNSLSTGLGLGSLDENSSIAGSYLKRNGVGIAVAVDEDVTTEGTYQSPSSAAHIRIGTPANAITGKYELHIHNDLLTSADYVSIDLIGATNMPPLLIEIQLTTFNLNAASAPQSVDNNIILAHADYGNAKLVRSTTPANALDVNATGEAGLDLDNTSGTLNASQIGADAITVDKMAPGCIVKGDQITGLNDLSSAQVNTECDTALTDYNGPTHAEMTAEHVILNANIDDNEDKIDTAQLDLDKLTGSDGATLATSQPNYAPAKAGDEMDLNDNAVDSIWDEVLTGITHNINNSAGKRLRQIQENLGYARGMIWIDTVNGASGTENFENGTVGNPVDNIADANTLSASLGINNFHVAPGSSITFAASQDGQQFNGCNWTLALGGQSISNTKIDGANLSGIATGVSKPSFELCHLSNVTLPPCHLTWCGFEGKFTIGSAGDFFFDNCHSGVAGIDTPFLDFGSGLDASQVNLRNYSGGIEVENMGAGSGSYDMSIEGNGQIIINANCSATSLIAVRGNFTITDNAGGAVTLSDDARYDVIKTNTLLTRLSAARAGYLDFFNANSELSGIPIANAGIAADIKWLAMQLQNAKPTDNGPDPATIKVTNRAGTPIATANVTTVGDVTTRSVYTTV